MALRTSKQLSSGWPQLTPAWSLTHRCITLWSGVLSAKFGNHRAFLKNLTSGWPWLTLHDRWPSNELHFDQGFFLPNLGSGGIEKSHSCKWAKWIQWHALPHIQQSTQQRNKGYYPNLHGWDFSIPPLPKFGGHTAFLSNLTSGWQWLPPAWPLTPAMYYALIRDSSHQIWWP